MAARVEGELAVSPESGLGLRLADGRDLKVEWAPGYVVVGHVLRDTGGAVVASLGDRIEIGGGTRQEGTWIACPGKVKLLAGAAASPS